MTKDNTFSQEMTSPLSSPDGSVLMNIPIVPVMDSIVADDGIGMVLKTEVEDALETVNNHDEEEVDINQMLSSVSAEGQLIRTNHSALQSLLSTASVSQLLNQPGGIQVLTVPTASDMISLPTTDGIQIVPTKYFGLLAIPQSLSQGGKLEGVQMVQSVDGSDLNVVSLDNNATIIMPPAPSSPDLPPGCPAWAARLKKCEKIGDSYRGYVENEVNLDIILTQHKQQTNSFWGTRQSPSTAKTSTRLMWKSQYVPFDGIPFINSGSRAVVMECQYGPRRKGTSKKSHCPTDNDGGFKQTCPARIYVKKVRKFPTYAVNLNMDKKNIRLAMDKAFHELREKGTDVWGEDSSMCSQGPSTSGMPAASTSKGNLGPIFVTDRYYVQLPAEEAHDYHEAISGPEFTKPEAPLITQEEVAVPEPVANKNLATARIHPRVLEKIRMMVANGETRLYAIRKQLRKFVLRDLYRGSRQVPERHDLTVFPTVNDLKNHIHQALTDIQNGALVNLSPHTPSVDLQINVDSQDKDEIEKNGGKKEEEERTDLAGLWTGSAMPETVTVTLTQNPEEEGHHIISRIETHLSDGTTQVSTTLTPETAQLLARLQPGLFRTVSSVSRTRLYKTALVVFWLFM